MEQTTAMKNAYFVENSQEIKVKQVSYYKENHELITYRKNSKKAKILFLELNCLQNFVLQEQFLSV